MQAVRGPRAGRSCLLPAAAEALAGPPSLHKVFGRSGTPCRPLLFKGRCQDPPQPKRLPLAQHRPCRSCSSRLRATDRPVAVTPSVAALLAPATLYGRLPADLLAGVRRVLLARARPSASVRDRHTPCNPRAFAHLTPQSLHRQRSRMFVPLSIGQHSPAHAPRGSLRSAASTSCIDPPHRQGIAPIAPRSPRAQGGHSCDRGPRPCGSRRNARTGPALVACLPVGRFLPLPALVVPRKAGAKKCTSVHRRSVVP